MNTMRAMMEEVKKPRFASCQEFEGLPGLPRPRDGSKRVSVETGTIRRLAQHRKEGTSTRNVHECEVPYLQDQAAAVGFDPKMTQLDKKLQVLTVQTQRVSEAQAAGFQSFKQQTEEKFREQTKLFQDVKSSTKEGLENLSEQLKCTQQAHQDQLDQFISDIEKSRRMEAAKAHEEWLQAVEQHSAATNKMMQTVTEEQRLRRKQDVQTLTKMVEISTTRYQEELSELRNEIDSLKSELDELRQAQQDMLSQLHKHLDTLTENIEGAFKCQDEKLLKQLEQQFCKLALELQQKQEEFLHEFKLRQDEELRELLQKHSEQVQQTVREEMQKQHDEPPAWLEAFLEKVRNK